MTRSASVTASALTLLAALVLDPGRASAAEEILTLDPEQTSIAFSLGATLHTARGRARLQRGKLEFDAETGAVRGEIVVAAKSLTTDNETRDANMHRDVLESEKYPEIAFRAERLEVLARTDTTASVRLHGTMQIHGGSHPIAIPAELTARGDRVAIRASFRLPYVAWGMRDYSNFVLRVDKEVGVVVEATASRWR